MHGYTLRLLLAPVIESRWFDTQRTEIYITLSTVVNFIINPILNKRIYGSFILSKGDIQSIKTLCRHLRPQGVDLFGYLVPALKQFLLIFRKVNAGMIIQVLHHTPFASQHAMHAGRGHAYEFKRHFAEGAHATNGKCK